eukprot:COSAG02_NODE_1979_length_10203_cov_19.985748_6_plen_147_part_00
MSLYVPEIALNQGIPSGRNTFRALERFCALDEALQCKCLRVCERFSHVRMHYCTLSQIHPYAVPSINRASAARFFRLSATAYHTRRTPVTVSENHAGLVARRGRRLRERYLSIPWGKVGPIRVDNPADRAIQHGEATARGLSGSCR